MLTLSAGLNKDTQVGLSLVEGLGTLSETSGETIVDESVLEDLLEGILNGHGGIGSRGLDDLDDLDSLDNLFNVGSSVRHFDK